MPPKVCQFSLSLIEKWTKGLIFTAKIIELSDKIQQKSIAQVAYIYNLYSSGRNGYQGDTFWDFNTSLSAII
jgi:hypothetical protein